jgi:hypothetical protein
LSKDVWTSVALSGVLSIPVSILCGLLLPFVQRWISDKWSVHRHKQLDRITREYIHILRLRDRPLDLTNELIVDSLFCILGMFVLILGMLIESHSHTLYAIQKANHLVTRTLEISTWAQQILGIVLNFLGSWIFSKQIFALMRTYSRVSLFDRYEQTVPQEVKDEIKRARSEMTGRAPNYLGKSSAS